MQRTEKLSGGAQGLICSWAGVVPRYHHGTWEERVGEEGLVVWIKSWGGHHCKALIESERRMPKQSRGIQGSTGDLRGKGEFGPVWREVSKELETSPGGTG